MKKDIFIYAILVLIFIAGLFSGKFIGGCLCGASSSMLIVFILGKRQAEKAISQVDQHVKNVLLNNMDK